MDTSELAELRDHEVAEAQRAIAHLREVLQGIEGRVPIEQTLSALTLAVVDASTVAVSALALADAVGRHSLAREGVILEPAKLRFELLQGGKGDLDSRDVDDR